MGEFEKQFTCLEENIEKYLTFLVPVEKKVTGIDKNGEEITKTTYCRLQFIDSARFMACSLSDLVNNLLEGIHKLHVNTDKITKNVRLVELNTKITTAFLNTQTLKMV